MHTGYYPPAAKKQDISNRLSVIFVEMIVDLSRQGGTDALDCLKIRKPGIGNPPGRSEMMQKRFFARTTNTGAE